MRRCRGGARDDRGGARPWAQGDARLPRRRDERRDRGGGASRASGRVGGSRRQSAHHRRSLSRGRCEGGSVRLLGPAGPRRDPRVNSYRVEVAVFAIAFTVFGLVALALAWSGDWAYAALANLNGVTQTSFLLGTALDPRRVETPLDLAMV